MQYSAPDSRVLHDIRSNLPETIRVFDPDEFFPPTTKADCGLPVDIQSDALDYDNASTLSNSLYDYVQIPIHASTPLNYASVRFPLIPDGKTPSETAASKAFLIVQTSRDSSWTAAYTVTIIPHPDYMTQGQIDSLDFFYDGFFNAVYIYADLEGKVFKAETYVHGTLWKTGGINTSVSVPDSLAVSSDSDTVISSLTPLQSPFDDIIYDYMPAVIITADRIYRYEDWVFHSENPDHSSNNLITNQNAFIDNLTNPFGGGGGKDGRDNADRTYEVVIEKDGRGVTSGQGTYKVGSVVYCDAMPLYVGNITTSEFINWSGYVNSDKHSITFTIPIEYVTLDPTISLTAHFHDLNPCADEETGLADPLMDMRILGSKGSGIKGGRYGDSARVDDHGNPQKHSGIDLYCPVGTPVFAAVPGVVVSIRTGLENGVDWKQYKGSLSKSSFNTGNHIYIMSSSGVITAYWHLTDIYVEMYQEVKTGDLIATSGITGNASSDGCAGPHLHFQVEIDWDEVNPEPYLHSIFDDRGIQTNPCDE